VGAKRVLEFIIKFLMEPRNTLFIKGLPGTGKTTLALEVLRRLKGKRHGFYLSSRVSYQSLKQQYPWVTEVLAPEDVRAIQPELEALSSYQDVRLADTRLVLEAAFESLAKSDRALLIFDSWDALAKEMEPVERLKAEKALVAAIDGRRANAIFISEEPERSNLDYLVDGVILLNNRRQGPLALRELFIEKLRGRLVDRPLRLYTLRNGRFEELPEFTYAIAPNPQPFEPLPDSDDYYSTGSPAIDSMLNGGLRRGSVILLEITPDTNRIVLAALLGVFVLNFINKGNVAMIGLTKDMEPAAVIRHIQPYSKPEAYHNLKVINYGIVEDLLTEYIRTKAELGRPTLLEFDTTFIDIAENYTHILELCRQIREMRDLLIMVADGAGVGFHLLKSLIDLHIKLWQDERYILLREVRTSRRLCALSFTLREGRPSLELVEIV
jgi:KaiC/GvpD/RAD55 family RecA-like ATPase